MTIKDVVLSKAYTGFFFDDQQAIKKNAHQDGFMYVGKPEIKGFSHIRQKGEAISIQLVLDNGMVAAGDCAAVQYAGTGGRDPLFLVDYYMERMRRHLIPALIGENVDRFRPLSEKYDHYEIEGKRLHTAIRYGLTQAFLRAASMIHKETMPETVRREYGMAETTYEPVKVFAQTGDERHINVDKMIMKEVDVLPHALINNVETKLGNHGEILLDYVTWLRNRILKYRVHTSYQPIFHIDVYGTIGIAFDHDPDRITDYLIRLEQAAEPFKIRIEGPIDGGDRTSTMESLRVLTKRLKQRGSKLEIVADEWCNSLEDIKYFADHGAGDMLQIKTPDLGGINNVIEAILYCNEKKIGSYCGGTCNETDLSAQVTTNIAIACKANQCLAKPGMGMDEGYMIVKNEMNRVLAMIGHHQGDDAS